MSEYFKVQYVLRVNENLKQITFKRIKAGNVFKRLHTGSDYLHLEIFRTWHHIFSD